MPEASHPPRLWNSFYGFLSLLLLAGAGLGVYYLDVPTLLRVEFPRNFQLAKKVNTISRLLEAPPSAHYCKGKQFYSGHEVTSVHWGNVYYQDKPQWSVELEIDPESAAQGLEVWNLVHFPNKELVDVVARDTPIDDIWISIYKPEPLRALANFPKVGTARLELNSFNINAFEAFITSTKIDRLVMNFDEVNPGSKLMDVLLSGADNIGAASINGGPLFLTENSSEVFDRIEFDELFVQYDQVENVDFTACDQLASVTILDSPLTPAVFESLRNAKQLEELEIRECELDGPTAEALANLSQTIPGHQYIYFQATDSVLTAEAVRALSKSKLDSLYISSSEPIDLDAVQECAEGNDISLTINAPNLTQHFRAQFSWKRGTPSLNAHLHSTDTDPLVAAFSETQDLDKAIEQVVRKVQRNDDGQITEIECEWLHLTEDAFPLLAKLPKLKRLRLAHSNTQQFGPEIAELQQLESLEIPNFWINDLAISQIGKLTNLKRLQLPSLPLRCDYQPERFPIDKLNEAYDSGFLLDPEEYHSCVEWGSIPSHAYDWTFVPEEADPDVGFSAKGLQELKNLKQLEYLWIPGVLLHPDSVETIASFPKLEELHALHTFVTLPVLERVTEMKSLKRLSIGIAALNSETTPILSKLGHLEALQIVIRCSEESFDKEGLNLKQEELRQQLLKLLPDTEIYVHVIDDWM